MWPIEYIRSRVVAVPRQVAPAISKHGGDYLLNAITFPVSVLTAMIWVVFPTPSLQDSPPALREACIRAFDDLLSGALVFPSMSHAHRCRREMGAHAPPMVA